MDDGKSVDLLVMEMKKLVKDCQFGDLSQRNLCCTYLLRTWKIYREICLKQRIWSCLKLHAYDVPEHGGDLQCLTTKKAELWQWREQVQR